MSIYNQVRSIAQAVEGGLATSDPVSQASLASIDLKLTAPLTVSGLGASSAVEITPGAVQLNSLQVSDGTAQTSLASIDLKLTAPLTVTQSANPLPVSMVGTQTVSDPVAQASLATIAAETALRPIGFAVDPKLEQPAVVRAQVLVGYCSFNASLAPQTLASGIDGSSTIITFDTTRTGVGANLGSVDAQDDFSGTGAQVVRVTYVNSAGAEVQVQQFLDSSLPGGQPITTDGTLLGPPASIIAINFLEVTQGTTNVDTIFAGPALANWVGGEPDVVWHVIGTGNGWSNVMFVYCPTDHVIACTSANFVGDNDTANTTQVDTYFNFEEGITMRGSRAFVNGAYRATTEGEILLPPGAAFWVEVQSGGNSNHNVSGIVNCLLIST